MLIILKLMLNGDASCIFGIEQCVRSGTLLLICQFMQVTKRLLKEKGGFSLSRIAHLLKNSRVRKENQCLDLLSNLFLNAQTSGHDLWVLFKWNKLAESISGQLNKNIYKTKLTAYLKWLRSCINIEHCTFH